MSNIFSKREAGYGSQYKEHLFEQYKLYVDSMERISDRRQQANNYFIAINTMLTSLIGLSFQVRLLADSYWLKILLSILGIIISVIFYFLIKAYRQLNTGKFVIIHEIEEYLPLSPYKSEWESLGEGKDNSKYFPFSHIEILIPWVFGILYTFLLIYFCGEDFISFLHSVVYKFLL
jgi:hypothetical protein